MIPVKTFENGAQALAHAQEWSRRRWMAQRPKNAPAVKPAMKFEAPRKTPERSVFFDQHVIDRDIWKMCTPKDFIAWRARLYGCSYDEIVGPSKDRLRIVPARHAAMVDFKTRFPELSLPSIGRYFGGRDHTTILNALVKHGVKTSAKYERRVTYKSGVFGVVWDYNFGKWRAEIYGAKQTRVLGIFTTVNEAKAARTAYLEAKRKAGMIP